MLQQNWNRFVARIKSGNNGCIHNRNGMSCDNTHGMSTRTIVAFEVKDDKAMPQNNGLNATSVKNKILFSAFNIRRILIQKTRLRTVNS